MGVHELENSHPTMPVPVRLALIASVLALLVCLFACSCRRPRARKKGPPAPKQPVHEDAQEEQQQAQPGGADESAAP